MASDMSSVDRAALLARDLEIVRRGRDTAPGPLEATVTEVKDEWRGGVLYQIARVNTARGPATIETIASVYRGARDIDPGSVIIADWARGAARFCRSIRRVHPGDTVVLAR